MKKRKKRKRESTRKKATTYNDINMSMKGREMQRGIALIGEIRIIQISQIVPDYALDQQDIVEDNCPSETHWHWQFDPGDCLHPD